MGQTYGCGASLLAAQIHQAARTPLMLITSTVASAESTEAELRFFSPQSCRIRRFPDTEVLPYDDFSPHPDIVAQRLSTLATLAREEFDVLVVAAASLFPLTPPRSYLAAQRLKISVGQELGLKALADTLDLGGYLRTHQVMTHGEFAVRGSLLDMFPAGSEWPLRLDFLDEQVDSIRSFDPESQLTTGTLETFESLPAREYPTDPEAVRYFRGRFRARFEGNPARASVYREISDGRTPGGAENYLPLFFDECGCLWDFIPAACGVICAGDPDELFSDAWQSIRERYEQRRHDEQNPALKPNELFVPVDRQHAELGKRASLELFSSELPAPNRAQGRVNLGWRPAPPVRIRRRAGAPLEALETLLRETQGRVLIVTDSPGRRESLREMLGDRRLTASSVSDLQNFLDTEDTCGVAVGPVEQGLDLPRDRLIIVGDSDLYGGHLGRRRRRRVRTPEAILNELTDLSAGMPVVHESYGVGRYLGLQTRVVDESPGEFLSIEYAGGDRLFVPVGSLHLISRFTGAAPEHAPLHRLGTDQWIRAKRRAAEQVRDVAAELLGLYAARESRKTNPIRLNALEMESFAAGFDFDLTEDQLTAVDEVIDDLGARTPMDRLVCGDVGFGKTEVALRAAFATVMDGGQVSVLVPTTLLAQQHFETFTDRFANWPVRVEMLSRFRTTRESTAVLAGAVQGTVDILIGTHRLLQRNVAFKNLRLAVIDEEHRFGVRQKEALKRLRSEVNVLTLTATPIPRTLNMALGSLRDLSIIATPPVSRLAVKTFITVWEDHVLRDACQREMKRGGQIYVVNPRIEDIEKLADSMRALVPDAGIEVAHGQMPERRLEKVMRDFYHRRFHILVCTPIIESGLDVPTANTIVINHAERFGLAQLHQLRGRVGRSHHQAFAYLVTPTREALTADAQKRLQALETMDDLGSGFLLATHDLEIRGAGELLGEEQSGQIQQVGFSLYSELLARTVEAMRKGQDVGEAIPLSEDTEIDLTVPALLPETYMPDVHQRLVEYKRIANAGHDDQLRELQVELIDRFGLLPEPARNLFRLASIRLRARATGIRRIQCGNAGGLIEFTGEASVDPEKLVALIQSEPQCYRLDKEQRLRFSGDLMDPKQRFDGVSGLIDRLSVAQPVRQ